MKIRTQKAVREACAKSRIDPVAHVSILISKPDGRHWNLFEHPLTGMQVNEIWELVTKHARERQLSELKKQMKERKKA